MVDCEWESGQFKRLIMIPQRQKVFAVFILRKLLSSFYAFHIYYIDIITNLAKG